MTDERNDLADLALTAAGGNRTVAAARIKLRARMFRTFAAAAAAENSPAAQVFNRAAEVREAAAAVVDAD